MVGFTQYLRETLEQGRRRYIGQPSQPHVVVEHLPSLLETKNLSLLVRPEPCIVLPKERQPFELFAPPKLLFDEVTRYLSWEEKTWRQKVIEETERAILNPMIGWAAWEVQMRGPVSFTQPALDALATGQNRFLEQLVDACKLPSAYLVPQWALDQNQQQKPRHESGDKKHGG